MPVRWTFRCYVSPKGVDEIRSRYEAESREVQAKFLSRLKGLSTLPFEEWQGNPYKALHGKCAGLGEIRFKASRVQHRPLGFRSGETEFTILFWATEKGSKFDPASACDIALARKKEIEEGRSDTNELWLALE